MNLSGPIAASSARVNGKLIGSDVSFTLPGIALLTHDFQASGTFTVPIGTLMENMSTKVTMAGISHEAFSALAAPVTKDLEFRAAQVDMAERTGDTAPVGIAALMRAVPTAMLPEMSITPGEAGEHEFEFSVSRLELLAGNKQIALIDRLQGICKINGVDYAKNYRSLV